MSLLVKPFFSDLLFVAENCTNQALVHHVRLAPLPVDQCTTAKGDFGVYFPYLQKCPYLSFTYFGTFGKPGQNPDSGFLILPAPSITSFCSKSLRLAINELPPVLHLDEEDVEFLNLVIY